MSESEIILTCLECDSPDIVKTLNNVSPDQYHCHNCMQEYFESVNYSSPLDVFKNKILRDKLQKIEAENEKLNKKLRDADYVMKKSLLHRDFDDIIRFYKEYKTLEGEK